MSRLVKAEDLVASIADRTPLLVDVRTRESWEAETIPGAVFLNVYDYFIPSSDEAGFADMESAIAAAFAALSIDGSRNVVYFEQETGMRSPRGLWFHEYAGLANGYVLDGGLDAWKAAGGGVSPGQSPAAEILSSPENPTVQPMRRELISGIAEMTTSPRNGIDIFDARRPSEFDGSYVHDCCARAGRIPGAKLCFFEDLLLDGRYRPLDEIRAIVEAAGFSPDKRTVAYCHRGARAATAYVALREIGFDNVSVFVGSWHEWAGRSDLPLETGLPANQA